MDDLTELLADVVALDEDERQIACGAQQLVVAREDRPLFGAGQAHETPPREMRTKGRVLPNDSQPGGEPAEHLVYGEMLGGHSVVPEKILRRG